MSDEIARTHQDGFMLGVQYLCDKLIGIANDSIEDDPLKISIKIIACIREERESVIRYKKGKEIEDGRTCRGSPSPRTV